jgi:hypothetical protein
MLGLAGQVDQRARDDQETVSDHLQSQCAFGRISCDGEPVGDLAGRGTPSDQSENLDLTRRESGRAGATSPAALAGGIEDGIHSLGVEASGATSPGSSMTATFAVRPVGKGAVRSSRAGHKPQPACVPHRNRGADQEVVGLRSAVGEHHLSWRRVGPLQPRLRMLTELHRVQMRYLPVDRARPGRPSRACGGSDPDTVLVSIMANRYLPHCPPCQSDC